VGHAQSIRENNLRSRGGKKFPSPAVQKKEGQTGVLTTRLLKPRRGEGFCLVMKGAGFPMLLVAGLENTTKILYSGECRGAEATFSLKTFGGMDDSKIRKVGRI